jgi:hypothetical protein
MSYILTCTIRTYNIRRAIIRGKARGNIWN